MKEPIVWILLIHFIADYPLQGDFLAQTKGKNFYSLFVHSMIYSLMMLICLEIFGSRSFFNFPVLLISHMAIDYIKANAKNKERALKEYLYIDQALHIAINFILLFINII